MALQRTAEQQSSPDEAAQELEQQQHAAGMVLPLLPQHDSIRLQLPLVCKLLCCSKWLAAVVTLHSAGQLDMPPLTTNTDAARAAPWLRKHARLLRSLDTNIDSTGACVAAVMAAGPQNLRLQSLVTVANNTTLPLLEQLPASCLTHLNFDTSEEQTQREDQRAFVARLSAALGRLTALHSLDLQRSTSSLLTAAPGLSGLSALTQLTALCFIDPQSDLQHVPPQLLELELGSRYDQLMKLLDLQHLSAVTALSIPLPFKHLGEGDVLPPNLLRLQICEMRSVQPLLPLVHLQQLQMTNVNTDITADQLRQLSRLTAVSLVCCSTEIASAGAWPLLPLQRLVLKCSTLSAAVCQHLAQLSGLTSLVLQLFQLPQAGLPQQLAAALQQLSGLQQLELSEPLWPPGTSSDMAKAGGQQLLQGMCSLEQLRELRLQGCPFEMANSSSLIALTALTSLSLSDCDLADAAVAAIVSQLPGLQCLNCSRNIDITDAVLPAIVQLRQLTQLSLSGTRVADAGLVHLTGLTRLRVLRVPSPVTAQQRQWVQQQLPDVQVEG